MNPQAIKLAAITCWLLVVSSCAQIVTENQLVFAQAEVNEARLDTPSCGTVRVGTEQARAKRLRLSRYFYLDLEIMSLGADSTAFFGPGLFLPLPVVPNPVAWGQSMDRHLKDASPINRVALLIRPVAYTNGWSLDPYNIVLEVDGEEFAPVRVSKQETHNLAYQPREVVTGREAILAHNVENVVFRLDYSMPLSSTFEAATLKVGGVRDREVGSLPLVEELLKVHRGGALHWKFDAPCD